MTETMRLLFDVALAVGIIRLIYENAQSIKRQQDVKAFHELYGRKGNWDMGAYNRGLYNGLELALATLEERDPLSREMSMRERAEK